MPYCGRIAINKSDPSDPRTPPNISFTNSGTIYVGPAFDAEKLFAYQKEASGRLNIAKTISNVIEGILIEQKRTS